MRAAVVLVLGGVLAGCGMMDARSSDPIPVNLSSRLADFDDATAAVWDLPVTPAGNLPANGSATYAGEVGVILGTRAADTRLVGSGEIVASFSHSVVDGRFSDFTGIDNRGISGPYRGALRLSGGRIDRTGEARFSSEIEGTLGGNGQNIVLVGEVDGVFRSGDGSVLSAMSNDKTNATVNDLPVDADVTLYAVRN